MSDTMSSEWKKDCGCEPSESCAVCMRSRLYGRSRANRWPLWISWLLAPSKDNRRIVRELMQIRRAGGDV